MLDIYAKSFMTATRSDHVLVRDVKKNKPPRVRWLPSGHWFIAPATREIDLRKL